MYYIESQGTPREIGLNHGRMLRDQIRLAYHDFKIDEMEKNPEGQEKAQRMKEYLDENFPDLIEEMEGIAEGAEWPFEKILWLTCFNSTRFEIENCSAAAIRDAKGGAVLGKTHDISFVEQRNTFVHKIIENGAIPRINIGSVGSLWSCGGVNTGGIAFGTTSAPRVPKQDGRGMPQHISAYQALKYCKTVDEIVEAMSKTKFAGNGLNMVFADTQGGAVAIEKVTTYQSVEKMIDLPVFRTNHYLDPELEEAVGVDINARENSRQRYERFSKILTSEVYDDAVVKMKKVVSDRTEPGAISNASTRTTWVLDPKASVAWVCPTRPEPEGFICFSL